MFPRIKFHRQTRWIGVPSNLLVPLVKSAFTLGLPPPPPRHPRSSVGRLINISRDTLAPGFLTPQTTSARASRSVPDDTVFIERRLPRVWGNHDPWIAMPSYERLPVFGDIGRIRGVTGNSSNRALTRIAPFRITTVEQTFRQIDMWNVRK